jgi:hypothetical protein
MRLMIWSTDVITGDAEKPCRVWHGRDLYGRPCTVYVRAIATSHPGMQEDMEKELFATEPVMSNADQQMADLDAKRSKEAELVNHFKDCLVQAELDGQAETVQSMDEWLDETIWRAKGRAPDRNPIDPDQAVPPDDTTQVMG